MDKGDKVTWNKDQHGLPWTLHSFVTDNEPNNGTHVVLKGPYNALVVSPISELTPHPDTQDVPTSRQAELAL